MGEFILSQILMTIVADTSPQFTTTLVVAGMGTVFAVLIILIVIFNLYGKLVSKLESTSKEHKKPKMEKNPAPAPMPKPAQAAPAPVVDRSISPEIVAAITAAIVASEGAGVTIRSIRKVNVGSRNPWAAAAIADNTRPF